MFGRVYSDIKQKMKYKDIKIPIVVKESKQNPDTQTSLEIIEDKLFICGYSNLTNEALLLMYIRQLYDKTVHLPLLLSYSCCNNSSPLVNRLVLKKYGLKKKVEIDLSNRIFNENPIWHPRHANPSSIFKSNISTVNNLFTYIHYMKKDDGRVKLPNNQICHVHELFDNLCISMLATHYLLTSNNIYPSDMHANNIFINWIDQDKSMKKDTEEIIYRVKDKYYKIKTFGFVAILGDVGSFSIKIEKDIILSGQACDIRKNYKILENIMNNKHTSIDFINMNYRFLTHDEYEQTVAYDILHDEPYRSYPIINFHLLGDDISYLEKQKTSDELLRYYDKKYGVKSYVKNDKNILIEC